MLLLMLLLPVNVTVAVQYTPGIVMGGLGPVRLGFVGGC